MSTREGGPGPRTVAVGGGHVLAASLRAARCFTDDITAVVSVADDGGSSGRLRAALPDLPAPGDVRRCLSALADPTSALGASLEHRFDAGEGLEGHAFGNLLLAALAERTGSFVAAVDEVARLVGAVGRVLPATTGPVSLEATVAGDPTTAGDGGRVVGQVAVQNSRGLRGVQVVPADAASPDAVVEAIARAELVVVGPGSLFTSVLAAATVPAVREAIAASSARRVYVANLRPQVPETEAFTLADHVAALVAHGVVVDQVLCDPVAAAGVDLAAVGVPVVVRRVGDDRGLVHRADRLAAALSDLLAGS